MRHETLRANGIDLFVRSTGDAAAPLVLFLHGFPEYSGAWDEVLPAFAEAVLDQALAAMLRWRELGINAPVAVNASPRSLLDPTFARMVAGRLAAHGVRGRDLIIELTEQTVISDLRAMLVRLEELVIADTALNQLRLRPQISLEIVRRHGRLDFASLNGWMYSRSST